MGMGGDMGRTLGMGRVTMRVKLVRKFPMQTSACGKVTFHSVLPCESLAAAVLIGGSYLNKRI